MRSFSPGSTRKAASRVASARLSRRTRRPSQCAAESGARRPPEESGCESGIAFSSRSAATTGAPSTSRGRSDPTGVPVATTCLTAAPPGPPSTTSTCERRGRERSASSCTTLSVISPRRVVMAPVIASPKRSAADGCSRSSATKRSRLRRATRRGALAVTVAARGRPRRRPSSPTRSPGRTRPISERPRSTKPSPSSTKKRSRSASPSRTTDAPTAISTASISLTMSAQSSSGMVPRKRRGSGGTGAMAMGRICTSRPFSPRASSSPPATPLTPFAAGFARTCAAPQRVPARGDGRSMLAAMQEDERPASPVLDRLASALLIRRGEGKRTGALLRAPLHRVRRLRARSHGPRHALSEPLTRSTRCLGCSCSTGSPRRSPW
jgi:hypothetical protein